MLGGIAACLGIILVLYSLITLSTSKRASPYALLIFSEQGKDSIAAKPMLLWINEQKSSVAITDLPANLEFHSQSLGTYPLSSLYAARVKTRQSQSDFLTDVSLFFRFPISGFLANTSALSPTRRSLLAATIANCTGRQSGSLSLGECLHLVAFWMTPTISIRELDFPKDALKAGSLDGLRALDREKYRDWAQSHFSDSYSLWKTYTVAVLNGTEVSGLATIGATVLEDFGLSILYVGETPTPVKEGKIALRPGLKDMALITQLLESSMHLPTQEDEALTTQYRSDIVVLIGDNEVKFFAP